MGDTGSTGLDRDPVHSPAGSEPARLREALRSGSGPQRAAAVRSALPAPGLEIVLVEALADTDPTVRVAVVRALPAVARSRGVRGLLRAATEDPSPAVRAEAVGALGALLTRMRKDHPAPGGRPA